MTEQESDNLKTTRWMITIIAVISLIGCLAFRPKTGDYLQAKKENAQMEAKLAKAKANVVNESPLSKENSKFDLSGSETTAIENVSKGVKLALGGSKDQKTFKANAPAINQLIGQKATKALYQLNGYTDDIVSSPTNFPFRLADKTIVDAGFNQVTNLRHAKMRVVATYYTKTKRENKVMLTFDYDLKEMKVNSSKVENFTDNTLSGNRME